MENGPKNRSEWFLLVDEHQNSRLTHANFCKEKNISLAKFSYYLKIYRKLNNMPIKKEKPLFSEVLIPKTISLSAAEIKIELPNGFKCQVSSAVSPDAFKKILGVLLSC